MEPWKPEKIISLLSTAPERLDSIPEPKEELEALVLQVQALHKRGWDSVGFIRVLAKYCAGDGGAQRLAAEAFGVSQGYIASLVRIVNNGCPSLLEALKKGTVNLEAAKKIARIDKGDQVGFLRRLKECDPKNRKAMEKIKREIDQTSRSKAPMPPTVVRLHDFRVKLFGHLHYLLPDTEAYDGGTADIPPEAWTIIRENLTPEVSHWLGVWKGIRFALGELSENRLLEPHFEGERWKDISVRISRGRRGSAT